MIEKNTAYNEHKTHTDIIIHTSKTHVCGTLLNLRSVLEIETFMHMLSQHLLFRINPATVHLVVYLIKSVCPLVFVQSLPLTGLSIEGRNTTHTRVNKTPESKIVLASVHKCWM